MNTALQFTLLAFLGTLFLAFSIVWIDEQPEWLQSLITLLACFGALYLMFNILIG